MRRPQSPASAALILLTAVELMVFLDTSVVNVALPTIGHGLRMSEATLAWVAGAYQLTFAGIDQVSEPHRESVRARVDISKNGRSLGALYPRMSQYENQREQIGSPADRAPRGCSRWFSYWLMRG